MVLGREELTAEKRGAELNMTRRCVLGLPSLVVTGVNWNGHGGADLLTGAGMEEDPLVKVTLFQHVHLVLTVQRFTVKFE